MKVGVLNELHMEYQHRFKVEFHQLLQQQTFAEVYFRNHDLLRSNTDAPYYDSLGLFFGCSFDGMALGLSRIWDERRGDENLISIPNLVSIFTDHQFLGCQSLACGSADRIKFESLYADPIRTRIRVVRTEALAHSVMVGKSKDRSKSDIKSQQEFGIVNGDAVAYCRKTLGLLLSLTDQLTFSESWRNNKNMGEMTKEWSDRHVAFLKHLVKEVQ